MGKVDQSYGRNSEAEDNRILVHDKDLSSHLCEEDKISCSLAGIRVFEVFVETESYSIVKDIFLEVLPSSLHHLGDVKFSIEATSEDATFVQILPSYTEVIGRS